MLDLIQQAISHPDTQTGAQLRQTTSVSSDRVFVQSMATGEGGTIKDNVQGVTLNLADKEFYFDIEILELPANALEQEQEPTIVAPNVALIPGCIYIARVSVSLNPYNFSLIDQGWNLSQNPVKIEQQLDLYLMANIEQIEFKDKKGSLELETRREWFHDFEFMVHDGYKVTSTTLHLQYCEAGTKNLPRLGSSLEILLVASQTPQQPEISYLAADIQPPATTLFLHVQPNGEEYIFLLGLPKSIGKFVLDSKSIQQPSIRHREYFTSDAAYVKELQQALHDYAIRNLGDLTGWVKAAITQYGPDCCIVIVDRTDAQIPWEMCKFDANCYLGAEAIVVRWSEMQYYSQLVELQLEKRTYEGRITSYIHPQDTPPPALSQIQIRRCSSPDVFQEELIPQEGAVSVAYLYYRGHLVYGGDKLDLDHLESLDNSFVPEQFRFDDVEGQLAIRPFFFVNAPYSGRMRWQDQQPCGLIAAALTQVASSYVGILGPMDDSFSKLIIEKFLELALKEEGVQPAIFLRQLRQSVVNQSIDQKVSVKARKRWRDLIPYVFTYVYYGNPNARVKVVYASDNSGLGDTL
jgi:hypothetical protein